MQIFDRHYVITVDTGQQIRNLGVYKLSRDRLAKVAGKAIASDLNLPF